MVYTIAMLYVEFLSQNNDDKTFAETYQYLY